MIIKTPELEQFVVIHRKAIEDGSLSWKARGLLAYLLAHGDGTTLSAAQLTKRAPDGRDSVLSGLRELEAAGWLWRATTGDGFDGTQVEVRGTGEIRTVLPPGEYVDVGRGLEPVQPKADPLGPAKAIVGPWWEKPDRRPVTTRYIAILKLVQGALAGGYSPDEIVFALDNTRAMTAAAMDFVLTERQKAAPVVNPSVAAIMDIAARQRLESLPGPAEVTA